MKVSIVTICFNQAAFLEQAICSVLDPDCGDIEYIVVDPGSTDGSRDIIARYGDRIVVGHDDWSIFRIHPASISGSQTLIEESRRNWDRYFERVIGRPRRPIDCLSWLWARIEKRLRDPVGLWLRIHDALLGVPQPNRF